MTPPCSTAISRVEMAGGVATGDMDMVTVDTMVGTTVVHPRAGHGVIGAVAIFQQQAITTTEVDRPGSVRLEPIIVL